MKATAVLLLSYLLVESFITIKGKTIADPLKEIENDVREMVKTVETATEKRREERVESAIQFANEHGWYKSHSGAGVEEIAEEIADQGKDEDGDRVIEGDIIESRDEDEKNKRSAAISKRWPFGIIYYEISSRFPLPLWERIHDAMQLISSKSCLTFTKRTNQWYWVKFVKSAGCSSNVGRAARHKQPQLIRLNDGCFSSDGTGDGTVLHEILHAAGFWHEQSRPDRDHYVRINLHNVYFWARFNFNKHGSSSMLGRQYDYGSVMHYGSTAFGNHGRVTIRPIGVNVKLGQRNRLSGGDVIDLNLLYRCKGKMHDVGDWTQFGPCNPLCLRTRQRFCGADHLCPNADFRGVETQTRPYCQGGPWCGRKNRLLTNVCHVKKGYAIVGHDIADNVQADNWRQCARECFLRSGCEYWTYTLPSEGSTTKECYLKSDQRSMKLMKSRISGSKMCGGCNDDNTQCGSWTKQGHCTKSPKYMMNKCKRSCGYCSKR